MGMVAIRRGRLPSTPPPHPTHGVSHYRPHPLTRSPRIQIWKNGRQLPLGRLFLWEGCAACQTMPRADVSVSTYVKATGDTECMHGTVGGFDVLVMDEYVRRSGSGRRAGLGGVLGAMVVIVAVGVAIF